MKRISVSREGAFPVHLCVYVRICLSLLYNCKRVAHVCLWTTSRCGLDHYCSAHQGGSDREMRGGDHSNILVVGQVAHLGCHAVWHGAVCHGSIASHIGHILSCSHRHTLHTLQQRVSQVCDDAMSWHHHLLCWSTCFHRETRCVKTDTGDRMSREPCDSVCGAGRHSALKIVQVVRACQPLKIAI